MSWLAKPLKWFYYEFGIESIQRTGRNAYLIILARTCRMVSHGAASLVLGLFLSELNFSDSQIGLFLTLTLLGDVFLGAYLTLIADQVGRRKVLLAGSLLMTTSGLCFSYFENFWLLLTAAVFGVVSATGGDFGPFRSIEESMISHLTTQTTRPDVLAWYVTSSIMGSAIGSEISGRIVQFLTTHRDFTLRQAYHSLYLGYIITGLTNVFLVSMLSAECELSSSAPTYSRLDQGDAEQARPVDSPRQRPTATIKSPPQTRLVAFWSKVSRNLSSISPSTRSIMYKLWFLLAVDSLADGMVPYSLTNYYMDEKFHPSKSVLGDATGASYLLGSVSTIFAGPLARKIGLINTMVFTHVPSSAAVLLFPAPSSLALTVVLLFVRSGLNSLDQAPRAAFIAAVVKPEERTATLGITSMVRTIAAMSGPTVTGFLANNQKFWIAFVVAGICRLSYDFGLYVLFVNMKVGEHDEDLPTQHVENSSFRINDEEDEDMTELDDLIQTDEEGKSKSDDTMDETPRQSTGSSGEIRLQLKSDQHIRRRSPSPLTK